MARDADVIVIGAGAVGASAALHLALRGHDVFVLEKEPGPALHQSGRNSGVIHAGYQYEPGSLKARFATEGARRLSAYCHERGVAIEEGGLLVLARSEAEAARLAPLAERARANGVEARRVGPEEAVEIEPHAAPGEGLHVPAYASFDARTYVHLLTNDAIEAGATFLYDTRVHRLVTSNGGVRVLTDRGALAARAAVNAAGLFADRLAGPASRDIRIVPFRGYFAELAPARRALVRSHVYGVPDLSLPFLGVHLSRRADGRVIVGPGAMLAFGREAYRFHQVNVRDLLSTLSWPGLYRLLARPAFRRLVRGEVRKSLSLKAMAAEARTLVPSLGRRDLVRSFAGNRAQVVDRGGHLVLDLVVREAGPVVHVLNAVSPGLTCSLPFGEHLAERAAKLT